MGFRQEFFKIYDRKVSSGEMTFFETGIPKSDFTRLCTDPDFVFDREILEKIAVNMKLSDEEKERLGI